VNTPFLDLPDMKKLNEMFRSEDILAVDTEARDAYRSTIRYMFIKGISDLAEFTELDWEDYAATGAAVVAVQMLEHYEKTLGKKWLC
jgi:hypothetical protein